MAIGNMLVIGCIDLIVSAVDSVVYRTVRQCFTFGLVTSLCTW